MAVEGPQPVKWTFTPGGTIRQYRFVKISADNTVIECAGATDVPIGIAQEAGASGGPGVEVCIVGITKVDSDAALTAGNRIGTSADGQADAKTAGTDTTEYVAGTVIIGSGAAGGFATAVINCAGVGRDA